RGLHPRHRSGDRVRHPATLPRAGSARRLDQVLPGVPLTATRRLADYAKVIGDERYEALRTLAKAAKGRTMLHIDATAYGGGVAEILQNLVPLLRDVGVDAHWAVLDAPAAFYDITKKIHNALQGMKLDLS